MIDSLVIPTGEYRTILSRAVLRIREIDTRSSEWIVAQTIGKDRYRLMVHADEVNGVVDGRVLSWPEQCPLNWEMA